MGTTDGKAMVPEGGRIDRIIVVALRYPVGHCYYRGTNSITGQNYNIGKKGMSRDKIVENGEKRG
jgi:hypothetical protein